MKYLEARSRAENENYCPKQISNFSGDSNLHLNVACKSFNQEIYKAVEPFVFEYTSKLKGSVSAEHGIGFHKTKYLKYSKTPEAIAFMKQIKQMMDPNGILNPYKVLPL